MNKINLEFRNPKALDHLIQMLSEMKYDILKREESEYWMEESEKDPLNEYFIQAQFSLPEKLTRTDPYDILITIQHEDDTLSVEERKHKVITKYFDKQAE